MSHGLRITIDIDKIEHNARAIVNLCQQHGIAVTGVTKGVCGHPEVAKAMLRGGVSSIGESRMENIHRLKAAGVHPLYMLLRLPPLSEVEDVVASVDISLNSEFSVLAGLSEAALRRGVPHDVILMVDLGDLREGIWPDDLIPFVREALKLRGVQIVGIGANLTCLGGVIPSEENMARLVALAGEIEKTFGLTLRWISGSNSSGLELIATGRMPKPINHARIGEGILLGRETIHRRPWPGTHQDAFLLHAEVLELKEKPSAPIGERSEDAFGELPVFENRGEIERAILNVGREDVDIEGLTPIDPHLKIIGASSDYLILDVTEAKTRLHVGHEVTFAVNYSALLAAMTSHYVEKQSLQGGMLIETSP
jgi:predicted amino acid racemase